ncbi:hypothetical protein PV326_003989 [Microctonus aethiopoides]|nr:hypothetical protein PV326_003989 [Microctonus aethiopoides]
MKVALAISLVFFGCCTNVVFLELLVKEDPGSGNLITFAQFLLISLEGFIFTSKFGTVKPRIGIKDYMILVVMFFVTSVCNNYAFDFNIPMPLHMIFRAGSLMANMIMGIIILKKQYVFSKYLSVFMITVGIVICTIVSGQEVKSTQKITENSIPATPMETFFWWILGISLLTIALFISARMGLYQEVLYNRYGKHPQEALYYTHLLPLPFFLTLAPNIWRHTLIAINSDPIAILGILIPKNILYLIGNVITHVIINRIIVPDENTITDFLKGEDYHPVVFSEKLRLLDHAVCINEIDSELFKSELQGNYDYLVADPMWIRMRIFLFWMFWAALVVIIVLSIFSYWCLVPSLCSDT